MGYIEKNLMEGEMIVGKARQHFSAGIFLVSVLMVYAVWMTLSSDIHFASSMEIIKLAALFFVGAVGWAYLLHIRTQFVVTNRRVMALQYKRWMRLTKIDLDQLKDVSIDQGTMGKKLGYGTVILTCVDGSVVDLPDIARPQFFRDMILEVLEQRACEKQRSPQPQPGS